MIKRIYTILLSGTIVALQGLFATPQSATNIKKIIQKKDEIIVIVHENGKDREIKLSKEALKNLSNKHSASKKTKEKEKPKQKSTTKEAAKTQKSNTTQKKKVATKQTHKKETVVRKEPKEQPKPHQNVAVKTTSKKHPKVANTNKTQTPNQAPTKLKKGQYLIKQGDTLFSIALKYKVQLSDLVKLNSIKGTLIHPGDILNIPRVNFIKRAKKSVQQNNKTVYRVQKGDTLKSIAKKYTMDIKTLRELNDFILHKKLKPGIELTVIAPKKAKELKKKNKKYLNPRIYTVHKGDTIWHIAKKYNLTIRQLRLLNPRIKIHSLKTGTRLRVYKKLAIKLEKIQQLRRYRLSGVLARYRQRDSYGGSRNVVAYAKRFLGSRYVWGASRPGAFDCSGFTQYVMKHAKGRMIPRVSRRQAYYGRYITRRNLRAGDLIFFDTSHRRRGYVNHVGIYIGNNLFIHASSAKHRVVITSLNKPFYRQRFMWGRRIN